LQITLKQGPQERAAK